ncbi:MAG: heavy metal-responsive transcriptional regulator [Planctomycetes bacterium]|nr:heavy metal-responsive transcriptional regulator [Planctomycetota bacterium]
MKPLTIGQVAQRVEVGIETIRFYEREGVLEKPDRSASGYRLYGEDVIARLRFVGRAKELGFTLKEIRELLGLRVEPTTTCADVRIRAETKIGDIEEKIRTLKRMKRALVKLTKACSGSGPTSECPILESIEKNGKK